MVGVGEEGEIGFRLGRYWKWGFYRSSELGLDSKEFKVDFIVEEFTGWVVIVAVM